MISRFLSICIICLLLASCAAQERPVLISSSDARKPNSEPNASTEAGVLLELNLTNPKQAAAPLVAIAEPNDFNEELNANTDISTNMGASEVNLSSISLLRELSVDTNTTSNELNASTNTSSDIKAVESNLSLTSIDVNASGGLNKEQSPDANSLDNDTGPDPAQPLQPLVLEAEELQLQRGVALEAEINIQSLGTQDSAVELVEEDRALTATAEVAYVNTSNSDTNASTTAIFKQEPLQDDAYQNQIALLLEAELAFQSGRYLESFDLRMDLARSSGDFRMAQEAYNSASYARDGEAMNQSLKLWLEQAPDDQSAHRLRLTQLLQSGQPVQALSSLEQLYFLGAEVDFSTPVSILIYPTEDQVRNMLDAYSQMALQYEERVDIWGSMLLLRIYLANILFLQQRNEEAQAELQALRSQQRGWQLVSNEALYALDIQEAKVNAAILSDREIESWYEQAVRRSPNNWQLQLQHLELIPDPEDRARALSLELIAQGNSDNLIALHSRALDLSIKSVVATIDFYLRESARIGNEQALQSLAEIAESNGQLVLADEYLAQLYAYPASRLSAYLSRLRLWLNNDQPDIARQIHRSSWQDKQLNQIEAGIVYARALNEFKLYEQSLRLLTILLQQSDEQNKMPLLLVRAETYMFRGDYALMEADLRKVIADAPEESAAYNTLGYVLADIDIRLDEAERLIDKALQIEPENAGYVDSLGWLAFRQGNLEHARNLIEWAYRRWQYADIIAHLGEIYWSLGEPERALYLWLDALKKGVANDLLISTIIRVTAAKEGVDLYQHLVARLQAVTSAAER